MLDEGLDRIADGIRDELDAVDRARERALGFSRELIRKSASAIRLIHLEKYDEAEEAIRSHGVELEEFLAAIADQPHIASAPFVSDGEKEHVEAWTTLCLATGREIPSPEELGTSPAAYLNGLAEGVMEIRRYVVDRLRDDDIERAEQILQRMDSVSGVLVTFDYPDAILKGLKRRLDTVRGVIEKTRHDITTAARQNRLVSALAEFERRVTPT